MFWECLTSLWFWMLVVVSILLLDCYDLVNGSAQYNLTPKEREKYKIWETSETVALLANAWSSIGRLVKIVFFIFMFIHLTWWIALLVIVAHFVIFIIGGGGIVRGLLLLYPDKTVVFAIPLIPICFVIMFVSFFNFI